VIYSLIILISFLFNSGVLSPEERFISESNTREVILEKALEALYARYDRDEYRFGVSARWIPGSLLEVAPAKIKSVELDDVVKKHTGFEVMYVSGNRYQKADIQLSVNIERKLPAALRRIPSGEVIKAEDLTLQWILLTRRNGQLETEMENLVGKTTRRTLLPGQPVRRNEISEQYLVEAGDSIQMIFDESGIRVVLTAEARQGGVKGDKIEIYSNETRKKYLGKVISPGVVKWQKTQ